MTTPVCIKRMRKERETLEKSGNGEYCVHFEDENLLNFIAYVAGPEDSLYRHKFIKLKFEIPQNYPLVPPKVSFVQHSGGRIHPNLYIEGKVCLSILGTWAGEPWATSMTVESVLITIRSLLDNSPFQHEPGQKDDPAYNAYVLYATWQSLLLDYVHREQVTELKAFMDDYIHHNGSKMMKDLEQQKKKNANIKSLPCRYAGSLQKALTVDYSSLKSQLSTLIAKSKPFTPHSTSEESPKPDIETSAPAPASSTTSKPPAQLKRDADSVKGKSVDMAIDLGKRPRKRKRAFIDVVDLT